MTKSEALKLEYRIKRLPADKKMAQFTKEESEMTIKKDLQAVNREIKALSRTMEKLIKDFDKSQKAQTAKTLTLKATKRVPAKKAPAKKRAANLTATDQILKIVNRSKKGVGPQALRKKTGFDDRKITNILQRAFKAGKIKRAGRGIYIGA
jgi:hypothetical protein